MITNKLSIYQSMKHTYCSIVVFLCFLVSCAQMPNESNMSKDVEIAYRTFHIDSKSITRPSTSLCFEGSAKYHGHYFCLFEEVFLDTIRNSCSHIFAISSADSKVKEVHMPDNISFIHPQLFVRNDSLLVICGNDYCYCIIDSICGGDEYSSWKLKKIQGISSIVYEDKEYCVKFTDKGEWGQFMSFIDKSDCQEHLYWCWGKVFKRQDGYYLCSNEAISRIVNPKEGIVHPSGDDYYDYYEKPVSHPEVLFSPSDPDILLNAFSMYNDTIYMLETYRDSTYLSKFDGQGITRIKLLEQKVDYIFSSSLGHNYIGYGDIYNFINKSKDEKGHYGIIDIGGNQIKIVNLLTNQPPGDNNRIDELIELSKRKEHVKFEIPN